MKESPVRWVVEYGKDGLPCRLIWSARIQQHGDAKAAWDKKNRHKEERRAKMPMKSMIKWARVHNALPK